MQDIAPDIQRIGHLIKEARKREGLNQQQAAEKAGLAYRTYGAYERSEIEQPTHEKVQAIARALHISELLSREGESPGNGDGEKGEPPALTEGESVQPVEFAGEDYSQIDVYDVRASAGVTAAEFQSRIAYSFKIHRFIMRRVLGIHAHGDIGVVEVKGDCMLPHLQDGDVCFFRYSQQIEGDGARHVLLVGGEPSIKRIQRLVDGSILLTCDNPDSSFRDQLLVPNEDGTLILERTGRPVELEVVGPVVWPRKTATQSLMQEVKEILHRAYSEAREV